MTNDQDEDAPYQPSDSDNTPNDPSPATDGISETDEAQLTPPPTEPETPEPVPQPIRYKMAFTGETGEYFKIWIVNLFLTIITLGIYFAWAKVRQRKYLYSNTWLGEHSFSFDGPPKALLFGYIVVALALGVYMGSNFIHPLFPFLILAIFFPIFPFVVWKAIRFKARYSSYRGIRFRFEGTLGGSYIVYFCWALLIPFTFYIILPYIMYKKKDYLMDNMTFGNKKFRFHGDAGQFYVPYLIAFGIGIAAYISMFVVLMIVMIPSAAMGGSEPGAVSSLQITAMIVAGILGYLVVLAGFMIAEAVIFTKVQNHSWERTNLGDSISFNSNYRVWEYAKIKVTNLLGILFSLGLLIPWATIRKQRYIIEHLEVIDEAGALDDIAQTGIQDETGLGDAAAEFMDFEIGL